MATISINAAFICIVDIKTKRVLVLINSKGKWMLPGGYVDPNESAKDAVVRELKEESGYLLNGSSMLSMHTASNSKATIFRSCIDFERLGHRKRVTIFKNRDTFPTKETYDYGFAKFEETEKRWYVETYKGERKAKNPTVFRKGTLGPLNIINSIY
jgi:8-oxo-dGTP pyrophosphatase MutT (NUDIX family)